MVGGTSHARTPTPDERNRHRPERSICDVAGSVCRLALLHVGHRLHGGVVRALTQSIERRHGDFDVLPTTLLTRSSH